MMIRRIMGLSLVALAACQPTIPESGPKGVGFGDYKEYGVLQEGPVEQPQTVAPPPVTSQPLGATVPAAPVPASGDLVADVNAALAATAPAGTAVAAPMAAATDPAAGAIVAPVNPVIDPVAAPVVDPVGAPLPVTAIPERTDTGRPNIVAYAIDSTNAVGQQVYTRSNPLRNATHDRACAKFASSDLAQEAFLQNGGPEKDGKSLDPDGDGFACAWDPTPFRAVAN